MCDYSLHATASRPARVGDVLVSTAFRGTQTRGFATEREPAVAVCLLPGTEVEFQKNAKRYGWFGFVRRIKQKSATFRYTNAGQSAAHHDALEFVGGQIVLTTHLVEGQKMKVLQLPAKTTLEGSGGSRMPPRAATAPGILPFPVEEPARRPIEQVSD